MRDDVKKAIEVIEKATANCAKGDRHLIVLDRGWIFAGDMSLKDDVYTVTNCQNIRKWGKGGFGALSRSAALSGYGDGDGDGVVLSGLSTRDK